MDTADSITYVTNEAAIQRYISGIYEQNLPITISFTDKDNPKTYRSSIQRLEPEKKQLVLHQILPGDWQQYIPPRDDIEITCRMPHGTIKFTSQLNSLDEADNGLYCQLSYPKRLSKNQLRDHFRVSVLRFKSEVILEIGDGRKFRGSCRDISISGALIYLPQVVEGLDRDDIIEHCELLISNVIELSGSVQVCRVSVLENGHTLLGIKFIELPQQQLRLMKSAINQLERQNMKQLIEFD